jgi:hypothetical protein
VALYEQVNTILLPEVGTVTAEICPSALGFYRKSACDFSEQTKWSVALLWLIVIACANKLMLARSLREA